MADIEALHACHHRRFWTEHTVAEHLAQHIAVAHAHFGESVFVAVLQIHIHDACERREIVLLAFAQLIVEKLLIVVAFHKFHDRVGGASGLHQHGALLVSASCASCHLLHHVESALAGTEVGETDQCVGIQNAHDAHTVEVESLGHHLRAHENVGLVR